MAEAILYNIGRKVAENLVEASKHKKIHKQERFLYPAATLIKGANDIMSILPPGPLLDSAKDSYEKGMSDYLITCEELKKPKIRKTYEKFLRKVGL